MDGGHIEHDWAWRDKNPTPLPTSAPFVQRRAWYLELQEKRKNWRYKNQEILPKIPAFDDSLRKLRPYIDQSRLEQVLRQGRVCEREAGLRDARRCVSFLRDELLGDFERAAHVKAASSMARWRELAENRCEISMGRLKKLDWIRRLKSDTRPQSLSVSKIGIKGLRYGQSY